MLRPDRQQLEKCLGLENYSYEKAEQCSTLLFQLHSIGGRRICREDYEMCGKMLLMGLFGKWDGFVTNRKRRCLWALNVPKVYRKRSHLPFLFPEDHHRVY